jgi:hypothetical protein
LAVAFPLSGERDVPSVFGSFFVLYYFSAMATGLLGLPAFLSLSRFNLVTWWSAVGCGVVAGAVALLALSGNPDGATGLRFSVLGACAGLLFWLVFRSGPAWPLGNHVA